MTGRKHQIVMPGVRLRTPYQPSNAERRSLLYIDLSLESPSSYLVLSLLAMLAASFVQQAGEELPRSKDGSISTDSDPAVPDSSKKRPHSAKPQGACVHCKSLKVRCQFTPGHTKCDRCEAGKHDCAPRTRKKRKAAPTQEDLQLRSREQDQQIQSLLSQFDRLKVEAKVNEWVRRAETTVNVGGLVGRPVRPATCHYYSSLKGPLQVDLSPYNPDFARLPMLLRADILKPYEVLDLFILFYERINPFFSLFDDELHFPGRLMWTSHLLFDVICACASRHYSRRPGLFSLLMDIAQDAASEALISGQKSVETVQAFLLLAVYPVPQKKWTDCRSWLLAGVAIRLAQELELDKMPRGDDERENFNRIRTWMNCFSIDKSYAAQFGKMHMVSLDDHVVRSSVRTWYKMSPSVNTPYDIAICGHAEMLHLLAKFRHEVGFCDILKQRYIEGFDVVGQAIYFDKQFVDLSQWWYAALHADPNYNVCPVIRFRAHKFHLVSAYMRLSVLSIGFQYAIKKGITRENYLLQHSITVAQAAIQTVIDQIYPSGFLSWAVEANFLYMAFCASFLLNLLRPKFLPLLTTEQCASVVGLVQSLIEILSSEDVALDRRHAPALYSKFLSNLLEKYLTPRMRANASLKQVSEQENPAQSQQEPTPLDYYSWPDTNVHIASPKPLGAEYTNAASSAPYEDRNHVARQMIGEPDMDFSLTHFVESTHSDSMDATSTATPAPEYTLEELQQLIATPPGFGDTNWLRSIFGDT
ncbi:hypothetical protein BC835DRAFT_1088575 [Cytidiella melzeri]|nr:hypothetical protein BC835DRAFT_1088575 [Cytidiella melzeri]